MIKKKYILVVASIAFLAILIISCEKKKAALEPVKNNPTNTCDTMKYATDIQPIFENKCYGCHTAANGSSGGIDLDSYAGVKAIVDNGKLKTTTIDWAVTPMPQDEKLPDSLITKLKCWVEQGAPNN